MKKLFLIAILLSFSHATSLLKYDVFDNDMSVDLKLSFDTPYTGEVAQSNEKNAIIITLKDLQSDEKFNHQLNSQIASDFTISPLDNGVKIELRNAKDLTVEAEPLADNSQLMLRFSKGGKSEILADSSAAKSQKNEPSDPNSTPRLLKNIIMILLILLALVAVLLIAKRFLENRNSGISEDDLWEAFDNAENKQESKPQAEEKSEFKPAQTIKSDEEIANSVEKEIAAVDTPKNLSEENDEISKFNENFNNFMSKNLNDFLNSEKPVENEAEILAAKSGAEAQTTEAKAEIKIDEPAQKADENEIQIVSQKPLNDRTQMAILKFKGKYSALFLGKQNALFESVEELEKSVEEMKKLLEK